MSLPLFRLRDFLPPGSASPAPNICTHAGSKWLSQAQPNRGGGEAESDLLISRGMASAVVSTGLVYLSGNRWQPAASSQQPAGLMVGWDVVGVPPPKGFYQDGTTANLISKPSWIFTSGIKLRWYFLDVTNIRKMLGRNQQGPHFGSSSSSPQHASSTHRYKNHIPPNPNFRVTKQDHASGWGGEQMNPKHSTRGAYYRCLATCPSLLALFRKHDAQTATTYVLHKHGKRYGNHASACKVAVVRRA